MRAAHLDHNDAGGYDLVLAHDDKLTRVFTRKDLRLDRRGHPLDLENCSAAAAARYRRAKSGANGHCGSSGHTGAAKYKNKSGNKGRKRNPTS